MTFWQAAGLCHINDGDIGRLQCSAKVVGFSRGCDEIFQPGTRVPGMAMRTIVSREATAFNDWCAHDLHDELVLSLLTFRGSSIVAPRLPDTQSAFPGTRVPGFKMASHPRLD